MVVMFPVEVVWVVTLLVSYCGSTWCHNPEDLNLKLSWSPRLFSIFKCQNITKISIISKFSCERRVVYLSSQ